MNASEIRFRDICLKHDLPISKSNRNEDIYEHWDFRVKNSLVDVKGLKKISRSDSDFNFDTTWVEIQNVRGDLGWLKGKADFIAFEQKEYYLITRRLDLLYWLRQKITNYKFVQSPKQALYRLYQSRIHH